MIITNKTITKSIWVILVASFLILGIVPLQALAATGYQIVGNSNGLVITSDNFADMGNLNPGDRKHSRLILHNTSSRAITVYMRTYLISEKTINNGFLADVLELTITDGDTVLTNQTMRLANEQGNIALGKMSSGSEKILDFYTNLPGDKTGNEYQGASLKVTWIFTTVSSSSGGPDDPNNPPNGPGEPELTVPDEDVPRGPSDQDKPSDSSITIPDDEEIPGGPAKMPKTGETSPLYYYVIGALITVTGIAIRKK